jgi:hypothetical protein
MIDQQVNISNFKKILNPVPAGTGGALGIRCVELANAVDILKEEKPFLNDVSGEEYVKVFQEYAEYINLKPVPVTSKWEDFLNKAGIKKAWTFPVTGSISEPVDTNINKLLDELSQRNQMINALSMSLEVSDRLFARLLNKLSIGIVLFFALTITICYLAFS